MRSRTLFWAAVFVTVVCVLGAQAQQKDPRGLLPAQPYPPLVPSQSSSGESSSTETSEGNDSPIPAMRGVNPDTQPLSGAEALTLGVGSRRSYLLPSVQFQQSFDSNSAANSDFSLVSILTGGLSWSQVGRRQQLAMSYYGGGLFGRNGATYSSSFHTLDARHTLVGRRWGLLLSDSFSYLPEASFGFVGLQGAPSSGLGAGGPVGSNSGSGVGGVPALNPYFSPQDTILSSGGTRIANQFVAQMQFVVSPRASITATGSFGVLHFLDPGFIDSKQASFTAGYNYALNTSDSVAMIYGASFFRFDGVRQRIQSQFVQATYGKRLTGRLAWRIAVGPQFLRFQRSQTATDTTVSASVENTLDYQLQRTGVSLSYIWYTSSGAGLILGSNTQDARATISRQLSRAWRASIDTGYARNTSLPQLTGASQVTFNTWRGGVSLSRRLGRNSNLSLTYSANGQNLDGVAPCVGTCAPDRVRHYILIGINWGTGPIVLD